MENFTEKSKKARRKCIFLELPTEIIYECLLYLEVRDAGRLIVANKTLYH